MVRIYVMQTGRTTWEVQSRVESAAGSPLSDEGGEQVKDAAAKLPLKEITAVYTSGGEAERQTAKLVAKKLRVKVRTRKDLHEFDYGLWQGLTFQEVRRRQPRVYKQWTEDPTTVRPPGGETLIEAQDRLRKALKGIVKRHRDKDTPILVVLSPVATGLIKCLLQSEVIEGFWKYVDPHFTWGRYDIENESDSL